VASTLFHDVGDDGKPEAGSFSLALRSEEWLEDLRLGGGVHAAAIVTDCDHNVLLVSRSAVRRLLARVKFRVLSFDEDVTAVWHGIAGVDDQIHDDLLDLVLIASHESQFDARGEL
jgi:hypothetical protein